MGKHAQSGGHSSACAFPADHDLVRPDSQHFRILFEIQKSLIAFLQGGGIRTFSGQTVLRSNQNCTVFYHKGKRTGCKNILCGAGLITSPVNPENSGPFLRGDTERAENQDTDPALPNLYLLCLNMERMSCHGLLRKRNVGRLPSGAGE